MFRSTDKLAIVGTLHHTPHQGQRPPCMHHFYITQYISAFRSRTQIRAAQTPRHATVNPETWSPDALHGKTGQDVVDSGLGASMEIAVPIAVESIDLEPEGASSAKR